MFFCVFLSLATLIRFGHRYQIGTLTYFVENNLHTIKDYAYDSNSGVYDISMVTPALLRRNLDDGISILLRGLRLLRCLSTHFSIVKTESVLGKRLSADVRIM